MTVLSGGQILCCKHSASIQELPVVDCEWYVPIREISPLWMIFLKKKLHPILPQGQKYISKSNQVKPQT